MSDNSETAAAIFDRTSKLATTLAGRSSGGAATALGVAAGVSKAVAAIIRAVGIKDAGVLIDGLARDKGAGKITAKELREDNKKIDDAIDKMYDAKDEPVEEERDTSPETPLAKSRKKRKS